MSKFKKFLKTVSSFKDSKLNTSYLHIICQTLKNNLDQKVV